MDKIILTALSGAQKKDVEKELTYAQKQDVSADAILVGRVDKETRKLVVRDMASAMLTKIPSFTTAANAPELFKSFKNSVTTNMSFADFTDRLDLIFRIGDFTVVDYVYPGHMIVSGGDPFFVPDTASAISTLAKYR